MRLATFETDGLQRLGAVAGERVIDVPEAAVALGIGSLPSEMLEFLRLGDAGLEMARATLAAAGDGERGEGQYTYHLSEVRLRAPIRVPGKIVCVGQNYRDHVLEQNAQMPEKPILFAKFSTCIIGPDDDIIHPTTTNRLDYEVELVVVIGRAGKHIPRERAYEHVAGYIAGQDVTARDLQRGDGQWVRGKAQDTTAPLGPYLVTRDDIPDPQSLDIKLWVNGELRQDSNTRNLIFDVPYLISFISEGITLLPGDIIYTGTPPGVGAFRKPPVFLQPGDEVSIEIDKLGRMTNRVVADPYTA